jgi:hypothetical protein
MPGASTGYGYGTAGAPNPSAYQTAPNSYQANYMTTLYPVSQPNLATEYEVRKKATFDALNEFFGDMKDKQYDPSMYGAMSRRLLGLSNLPSYTGATEYSGGTAIATATHPPSLNHYTLPMPSLRTKGELLDIDRFLEQLQATTYEHETPTQAANAGVAQAGSHYIPTALPVRSSHSPPRAHIMSTGTILPPLTSTAMDTPALTPDSSALSYHSPQSTHSSTISPVSRPTIPLYPTIPSTMADAHYTTHGSASALTSTHDPNIHHGSRRYQSGNLNAPRPSNNDELPRIESLGVRSPTMANVDPALRKDSPSASIDPELSGDSKHQSRDSSSAKSEESEWIVIVRVLEAARGIVKERLEQHVYDSDSGNTTPKPETEAEKDARDLYPVIRAVQDHD